MSGEKKAYSLLRSAMTLSFHLPNNKRDHIKGRWRTREEGDVGTAKR